MQQAHGRANELDAILAAAMEAAADRAGRRAAEVILRARLATAVHMCRAAELAAAQAGQVCTPCGSTREAAPAPAVVAASGMRSGGTR